MHLNNSSRHGIVLYESRAFSTSMSSTPNRVACCVWDAYAFASLLQLAILPSAFSVSQSFLFVKSSSIPSSRSSDRSPKPPVTFLGITRGIWVLLGPGWWYRRKRALPKPVVPTCWSLPSALSLHTPLPVPVRRLRCPDPPPPTPSSFIAVILQPLARQSHRTSLLTAQTTLRRVLGTYRRPVNVRRSSLTHIS